MKNPKVTILMPVYNNEKYLCEAIDSILNQSFKDFEFLIINDGSTDGTSEVLKRYQDPRIKIIDNKKNIGLTKSLNKGLKIAKGEYIARMDADDISLPERLERQIRFLDHHPTFGVVGSSWYLIKDGEEIGVVEAFRGDHAVHFMCHGSVLMRKNCVEQVNFYREIFRYAQDYDLWLRLAEKCKVMNLKEPLYKLRIRNGSISSSRSLLQSLYGSLAYDMAEERKRTGKDKLSQTDFQESLKIVRKRLRASQIKKRKFLSYNNYIRSRAYFSLAQYTQAYNYAGAAIKLYILNFRAWNIISKVIGIKYSHHPIRRLIALIFQIIKFIFLQTFLWKKLRNNRIIKTSKFHLKKHF